MAQDGKSPGDGKSSPFGDGKGGAGGSMQGNDFTQNPTAGRGGGGGQPTTRSAGGGQPSTYQQSRPQQMGGDPDINPNEIPAGGKDLLPATDPSGEDTGNPRGTGSVGNPNKPFRLGGG